MPIHSDTIFEAVPYPEGLTVLAKKVHYHGILNKLLLLSKRNTTEMFMCLIPGFATFFTGVPGADEK